MQITRVFIMILMSALLALACTSVFAQDTTEGGNRKKKVNKIGYTLYGQASFYADKFHGRQTATGEKFSQQKFTAACNSLPLGTWIQVSNLKNGKIVVVKTNDRLDKKTKRLIDLTRIAAAKLGFVSAGLARVKIVVLDQSLYNRK